MSNIFETLNRTGGEVADLIRPVVNGAPALQATGKQDAAAQHVEPAIPKEPAPPAACEADISRVRTLSLRIPAPSPLLPFEAGPLPANEQYRILRTRLTHDRKQPRLIVISSADAGDGKSITATNVAAALSLKDQGRTLLVDADLRKSMIHIKLGLPEAPGLTEVLQGKASLGEALVQIREFPNLYVLAAGTRPNNPAELLDSTQWPALCARLRTTFRFVIVDSPPVGAVTDYDLIQAACDGIILVVRPDHTDRELLRKGLEALPKERFLGVLLNCVPAFPFSRYYGADHYYRYRSSSAGAAGRKAGPSAAG